MKTAELLKKVRHIEIKTKVLTDQIFAGQYHSAFKGRGMTFSEVREYSYGDDVRTIDWNVTARFNHPYVKVYEEERELTAILLVDVSGSQEFGTFANKKEYITELAAVLAFSAIRNNDKIGVIFFSDRVEKFIPPKKGTHHTLRIIRELLSFEPKNKRTDISEALKYLTNVIKKKAIVFLISDFLDNDFEKPLLIASKKHDIVAIKVNDRREYKIPNLGLVNILDPETGESFWADTANIHTRNHLKNWYEQKTRKALATFKKAGVDYVELCTNYDYVKPLIQLFKMRGI